MKKDFIFNFKEMGKLYLIDVLFEYIFPRIFVCEDENNEKYLFYSITEDVNYDRWIFNKISKDDYYNVLNGNEPIQKYLLKDNSSLLEKDYLNDGRLIFKKNITQDDLNLLANEPFYVTNKVKLKTI